MLPEKLNLMLIFLLLTIFSCTQNPAGPPIPENKQLAVYCVLNPTIHAQTIQIERTKSFEETINRFQGNLDVKDAKIKLAGPDGDFSVNEMQPESQPEREEIRTAYDIDFIEGGGKFNYLLSDQKVQPGEKYSLEIDSDELGGISAETQIPGAFEITEVNLEPNLTEENWAKKVLYVGNIRPKSLRVVWSPSEGAAGYLVDITVVEYDIPFWLQHNYFNLAMPLNVPDSTKIINIPYREIPVDFAYNNPNRYQRGILTRDTKIEIPRERFRDMVGFKDSYQYRRKHIRRFRVYVHSLDQALYNFMAFQYFQVGKEETIGQEMAIPDMSNIAGGVGILGSAFTTEATSRILETLFQDISEVKQDDRQSQNKNEFYVRRGWNIERDPVSDIKMETEDGIVVQPGGNFRLNWSAEANHNYYFLILKPHYMWFWPGNLTYLLDEPFFDLKWEDLPFRNCTVDWYVTTLHWRFEGPQFDDAMLAVSGHKAPVVASNYYFSDWSETRSFTIPADKIIDFESRQPFEQTNGSAATTSTFSWTTIEDTDLYLFWLQASDGDYALAVSPTNQISLPFSGEYEAIEGLCGIESLKKNVAYTWRVCGLHVKSGLAGFIVEHQGAEIPPKIFPRYEHPSGIVQQSHWSAPVRFSVK